MADYSAGEKWVWKYKGVSGDGIVRSEGIDTKQIVEIDGQLNLMSGENKVPLSAIFGRKKSQTPRYDWPLKVGKKWTYESSWTNDDGSASGKSVQDAEVLSYEEITVDAGTFMVYQIRYDGEIINSRGSADTVDIVWYAPKVKNFVKFTQLQDGFEYNEELVNYSKPLK